MISSFVLLHKFVWSLKLPCGEPTSFYPFVIDFSLIFYLYSYLFEFISYFTYFMVYIPVLLIF
jgi:hypothetical protein